MSFLQRSPTAQWWWREGQEGAGAALELSPAPGAAPAGGQEPFLGAGLLWPHPDISYAPKDAPASPRTHSRPVGEEEESRVS